jgi:hypothetical protein
LAKTYPLTQKGNGQLSVKAGELSTRTYHYVLKIGGVKVDSKTNGAGEIIFFQTNKIILKRKSNRTSYRSCRMDAYR